RQVPRHDEQPAFRGESEPLRPLCQRPAVHPPPNPPRSPLPYRLDRRRHQGPGIRLRRDDLHRPVPVGGGGEAHVGDHSPVLALGDEAGAGPIAVVLDQSVLVLAQTGETPPSLLVEELRHGGAVGRQTEGSDGHPGNRSWQGVFPYALQTMSSIGLVLGGGGITGAAFQLAALMSLELACDWRANDADVVIGTSGGAYVASLVRCGKLDLDSLVRHDEDPDSVADRIRRHVFTKNPSLELGRWLRGGVLPGLRRPGMSLLMGSPARYTPHGLAAWVEHQVGPAAHDWPTDPTVITAYDVESRQRVGFGTGNAPRVSLAHAVAASSAIPVL